MSGAQAVLAASQVSTGEAVAFWILGPVALLGAIGMVLLRNAVHSALSLVATMMCLGLFYLIQQGPFLGLVQIIVYTGAIMILFLFVLMLVGRDSADSLVETLRGQRAAALVAGVAFALLVALGIGRAFTGQDVKNLDAANTQYGNNVNGIAHLLFTKYLFAFELTSALLIVAAVGAMVLAHIEREGPRASQKSLARERIRSGRPQPLPGPGVLSSGNAVGTPALLPDGSVAAESLLGSGAEISVGAPHALPGPESGRL
ncbi:MAG TPA: NADH-quinone oxidoreductase subunit J [Jatrophihabitans sp.]|jgi:NADH-quinone oxidoreductase subunit J|uniref:NADH-quinone oxidoreductase subunit J n=1 Tax=Jatrophihabitans sp. TaxID=1932789 RepID=UPI002F1ED093